ncbi:MAG: LamG domain-containing protein, partial [Candidatus Aenigmatarchaeota archaeon]
CSRYRNHGTLKPNATHGPQIYTGKIGKSLKFNGSGQYVEVSDDRTLDSFQEITVSAFINLERPRDQMSASYPSLIDHENLDNGGYFFGWYWSTGSSNENAVGLRINNNSGHWGNMINITQTDTWIHIAATYNGTHISLYRNGKLESSKSVPEITITDTSSIVAIGDGFEGAMDEVRIYDTSLSEQIQKVYRGGDIGEVREISITFSPRDINITSTQRIGSGTHSLLFRNEGYNNSKTKISVRRL